jgi:transposase/transposase-like protein
MSKPKTFRPWTPEQTWFLPPSPMDWLPVNHLVFFLLDLIDQLDLDPILRTYREKDPRGEKAYDPRMMVVLLLYAYCVGLPSSRKIEKACYEDLPFRVLSANQQPDHTRISEFRRRHLKILEGLFLQVLQLCQKAGLVQLGHVALDGTKVEANASKQKSTPDQQQSSSRASPEPSPPLEWYAYTNRSWAMPLNKVQYQPGFSLTEFIEQYRTEEQCEAALVQARWPEGFQCPRCNSRLFGEIHDNRRKRYQCKDCRHQTTATAGTIFEATKVPLTRWFQAIYFITHAKTGVSAMELGRHIGVSYPTSWKIKHKIMQAMQERDNQYLLRGIVQLDDAYLGGELSGGSAGRGSENKVPFVAAVELNEMNRPIRIKMNQVTGFTLEAIKDWSEKHVVPGSTVTTDGLGCFRGVVQAGCKHIAKIVGGLKPKDLPLFQWLNTILGNIKTGLTGTFHAFKFNKYADRYLAEISYRFNRRFNLKTLHQRLLIAALACPPCPERLLRSAEFHC